MRNSLFVSHLVSHFVRFSVLVCISDEVRDKVRDEVFIYFAIVWQGSEGGPPTMQPSLRSSLPLGLALILLGGLVSCKPPHQGKEAPLEPAAAEEAAKESSVKKEIQSVVDGMTGIQAIEKGEDIKQKLRDINTDRQRQLEEYEDF